VTQVGVDNLGSAVENQGSLDTTGSILSGGCGGSALSSLGGDLEVAGNTCGLTDPSDQVAVATAAAADPCSQCSQRGDR